MGVPTRGGGGGAGEEQEGAEYILYIYNKNESNKKNGCKAGTTAKGRSIKLGNILF